MSKSKPKAKLGYVGLALVDESLKFDPEIKERLRNLALPAGFVGELEFVYREFLTLVDLHASSPKPAETLETLRSLKEEVGTLSSLLESGHDPATVCEAGLAAGVKDNWFDLRTRLLFDLGEAACYLTVTLGKLEDPTTGGAKRGRLEDHASNFAGIAVMHLFKKHGLPLSETEHGLFDTVLCVLLSKYHPESSVRYLIRKILPPAQSK